MLELGLVQEQELVPGLVRGPEQVLALERAPGLARGLARGPAQVPGRELA